MRDDAQNGADDRAGSAGILIIISMALTLTAGLIPSGAARRKDPVTAPRTE